MNPKILILETIHDAGVFAMSEFADVDIQLNLSYEELQNQIPTYDAIIVKSATQVDKGLLDLAQKLKVVGRAGTGLENIDLAAAAKRDVEVIWTPNANTVSAAEFTIALMLNLTRRIPDAIHSLNSGDFRRDTFIGRELSQMRIGLVGLGAVGISVAERLSRFGCELVGYDPLLERNMVFKQVWWSRGLQSGGAGKGR